MLANKEFNTTLKGVITSAKNQRDKIQALIVSGLEEYQEHGNTGQLSRLIQAVVGVRSLPTNTLRDFIKAHANVMFTKAKDGSYVFKKMTGEKEVAVTIPDVTWYNWKGNPNKNPNLDFDVAKALSQMVKRVAKAMDEGKVKEGQEEEASLVLSDLSKLEKRIAELAHEAH